MTDELGRQLVEVKLPHSGKLALIVPYFTGGEREQIQDVLFGTSEAVMDKSASFTGLKLSQAMASERKALELGVKHLDAPTAESPALATTEALKNLPEDDYDLLKTKLNETTSPKATKGS